MAVPRLVTVRHAKTDVSGLCIGRTDVMPTIVADEAARTLERFPQIRSDIVWTSPLIRCRELAEILARPEATRVDERLLEMDFGSWEGRTWKEIEAEDAESLADWMQRWQTDGPPGGGESAEGLAKRTRSWWNELDPGASHLLVAHAGVVRALHVVVEGLSWPAAMNREVPHLTPIVIGPSKAP
jgi:alpha-ribazole phosphatase